MLNVGESSTISAEGKLDTCGSVSFSYSSHLQQVKDCREYCLEIGGKTKPLREADVLHVGPWNEAGVGKGKKILCHKCDEDVGNTDSILLSSLRTIRNANIDIPHHMDKSLDGMSSPLLFLQDKDPRRSRKKARPAEHAPRRILEGTSTATPRAQFC